MSKSNLVLTFCKIALAAAKTPFCLKLIYVIGNLFIICYNFNKNLAMPNAVKGVKLSRTKLIIAFVVGGLAAVVLTLGVAQFIYVTGNDKFCSSCHVMEPMWAAYKQDTHGGANKAGFKAECAACHLPHDNILKYTFQKAVTGTYELAVNTFGNPEKIDWQERRKERAQFVFDSGCLHCHGELEKVASTNQKAFLAHRDYFAKNINKKCVECHENVGHKDLGLHLRKPKS